MNKKKLAIVASLVALSTVAVFVGVGFSNKLNTSSPDGVKEMTEKEKEKQKQILLENNSQRYDESGELPENRFLEGVGGEGTMKEDDGKIVDFTESTYEVLPDREEVRSFPEISREDALEFFTYSPWVTMGKEDLYEITDAQIKSLGRYPTMRELLYTVKVNIVETEDGLEYWFKYKGKTMSLPINGPDHVLDLLSMAGLA